MNNVMRIIAMSVLPVCQVLIFRNEKFLEYFFEVLDSPAFILFLFGLMDVVVILVVWLAPSAGENLIFAMKKNKPA